MQIYIVYFERLASLSAVKFFQAHTFVCIYVFYALYG